MLLALGLGAYLLGSVPTAYIMVRLVTGHDIRRLGTKNVGTLNTYHQLGTWAAVPVLVVDAGKGALAVLVPAWLGAPAVLVPAWLGAPHWAVFMTTALVVAGHNWPVFLKFRGGKGAAAIFGVSLALAPVLTLITLAPVVVIVLMVRNVVLGVAFGFLMLNTLLVVTGQDPEQIALCIFLTMVVTVTYLVSTWNHVVDSIKGHRWKELFTGLA